MRIYKNGIFRTIDAKDFGIYQQSGWVKAIKEEIPLEEPMMVEEPEIIVDKPKAKKK